MRIAYLLTMSVAIAAIATRASAQDTVIFVNRTHSPSELDLRSAFSISVAQTRPLGALSHNIGFGYGGLATYHLRGDSRGIWSLRADLGIAEYGDNTLRVPLTPISGRVRVDVKTTNNIVPIAIGPQLMWPSGSIRPYVNAGVGGQWFFTESHIDGEDGESFASTTNHSDFAPAWTAGGGVYVPVYTGKLRVLVDLGVQYFNGGTAGYLNKASIVDLPNGDVRITPLQSDTHLMFVRLGARIGR